MIIYDCDNAKNSADNYDKMDVYNNNCNDDDNMIASCYNLTLTDYFNPTQPNLI